MINVDVKPPPLKETAAIPGTLDGSIQYNKSNFSNLSQYNKFKVTKSTISNLIFKGQTLKKTKNLLRNVHCS